MSRVVPILMVIYNNDAVEIRYSDGSSLQLSSCGSTMIHCDAPHQRNFNRGTSKSIHKRCRYVTSDHRTKVVQALDFRNRFAERPYLCEELLPKEDVVALYTKLESVEWPKTNAEANLEVLPDGSRKITSLDEHASLVVSPHGHDFTVCYLSKLSSEKSGQSRQNLTTRTHLEPTVTSTSSNFAQASPFPTTAVTSKNVRNSLCPEAENINLMSRAAVVHPFQHTSDGQQTIDQTSADNDGVRQSQGFSQQLPHFIPVVEERHGSGGIDRDEGEGINEHVSNSNNILSLSKTENHVIASNDESLNDLDPANIDGVASLPDSTLASHDISSISRSSTPDGLRTTIDSDATLEVHCQREHGHYRHSSPTHLTSSPGQEVIRVKPKCKQTGQREAVNVGATCNQGNYESNNVGEGETSLDRTLVAESPTVTEIARTVIGQESDNITTKSSSQTRDVPTAFFGTSDKASTSPNHILHREEPITQDAGLPGEMPHQQLYNISIHQRPSIPGEEHISSSASRSLSVDGEEETASCRHKYIWTTSHGSRNACPASWTHALQLALAGKDNSEVRSSRHKINERNLKERHPCHVPVPLPVTCPFQHLHKWDAEKTLDVTDVSSGSLEFQHGMLKIVISEGIVYRLVSVAGIHIAEVHPGDGSVLVSQGVKGHFFTHYIAVGDQLEERTYSLKSSVPGHSKGRYSISKLMNTASRYLTMNQQWERRGLRQDTPCWKRETVAVVKPLSSSLLEECSVEGLGKFSAFTNGRVRVVFTDRTALDMQCNLTSHSSNAGDGHAPLSYLTSSGGFSVVRLLLPTGQEITVDANQPGPYRRYIEAGQEWISWINCPPLDRHQFYMQSHGTEEIHQAAQHELKKIFCFNYILEQTLRMQQEQDTSIPESHASSPRQPHTSERSSLGFPGTSQLSSAPTGSSYQTECRGQKISPVRNSSDSPGAFRPHDNLHSASATSRFDASRMPQLIQHPGDHGHIPSQSHSTRLKKNDFTKTSDHWVTQQLAVGDQRIQEMAQGFDAVRLTLLRTSNLIDDIDSFLSASGK